MALFFTLFVLFIVLNDIPILGDIIGILVVGFALYFGYLVIVEYIIIVNNR